MKPGIYFSQSINERSWHVWKPITKVGEHHGAFFFYVDSSDSDDRTLITPPRGLYGKEFLELDHRDVFQLLEFQQRWGPITGLRAQPNTTFSQGTYPNVALNDSFYGTGEHPVFHPDGITKTLFLYEGMGDADIIARERYGVENHTLRKVTESNWLKKRGAEDFKDDPIPCHVASIEEVSEAVCDAQVVIRAITGILQDGYTEDNWQRDKRLVLECVRYCNAVLNGSVSPVDIIEDGNRDGICTLMQYLFICLAKGVMHNNAYRFCQNPECGRLFTPRECNRRIDSKYCCEDCQIKAKYLRTFRSGKKVHRASQPYCNPIKPHALRVEWSTSNIPIKVLRREDAGLLRGMHDSAISSDLDKLLLLQSFLGLTTGQPRTEGILNELKSRFDRIRQSSPL